MATEAAAKPRPEPTRDSKPYWDGLNEGRLLLQQWGSCLPQLPPESEMM